MTNRLSQQRSMQRRQSMLGLRSRDPRPGRRSFQHIGVMDEPLSPGSPHSRSHGDLLSPNSLDSQSLANRKRQTLAFERRRSAPSNLLVQRASSESDSRKNVTAQEAGRIIANLQKPKLAPIVEKVTRNPRCKTCAQYADTWSIPCEILLQAIQLFIETLKKDGHLAGIDFRSIRAGVPFDPADFGAMTKKQFTSALCKLCCVGNEGQLPDTFMTQSLAGIGDSSDIDLKGFASFYFSQVAFSADVGEASKAKNLRHVADKHDISYPVLEKYWEVYSKADTDGSGLIEYDEFQELVRTLWRLPRGADFPEARMKEFWRQADINGSGELDFEEFVIFYHRWFGSSENIGDDPMTQFYRSVRKVPSFS